MIINLFQLQKFVFKNQCQLFLIKTYKPPKIPITKLAHKVHYVVAGTKPCDFTIGAQTFITVLEPNILPSFTIKYRPFRSQFKKHCYEVKTSYNTGMRYFEQKFSFPFLTIRPENMTMILHMQKALFSIKNILCVGYFFPSRLK